MIAHVVGARPQFIKLLPLYTALKKLGAHQCIIHTGQHWEEGMSDVFFKEFGINPDKVFEWDTPSLGEAIPTKVLKAIKNYLLTINPKTVIVYGDTNSTITGAVASKIAGFPVAHVEAGLRSFNSNMPEERCRILTDILSDWHFAPSRSALLQLKREGLDRGAKHSIISGDVMADLLISRQHVSPQSKRILVTLHRNTNVDNEKVREKIISALAILSEEYQIQWPIHPRLRSLLDINKLPQNINWLDPLGRKDLINELENAEWVITDSGGLQKEAYFLKRPCIVLRAETEWKELISTGSSILIDHEEFRSSELMARYIKRVISEFKGGEFSPIYGDGNAATKIANALWLNVETKPNSISLEGNIKDKRLLFVGDVVRRITGVKIDWNENGLSWPKSNLWDSRESMELWTTNSDFHTPNNKLDYLALIAFGASRSQEWHSSSLDEHGRYKGENFSQTVLKEKIHDGIPELHLFAEKFIQYYRSDFILADRDPPPATIVVDVDHLYAFKGFSFLHKKLGSLLDILMGKWARFKARFSLIDPFDSTDIFIALRDSYVDVKFQFFAWVGPIRGEWDKGPTIHSEQVKLGLRNLFKNFPSIGIHPSYLGHENNKSWIKKEADILANIVGQKIVRSRFHYLRMSIPNSYLAIDEANIDEDWSMEYAHRPGYRCGVAVPIPVWMGGDDGAFNEFGLPYRLWYPVAIMDQNLINLSSEEITSFLKEWTDLAARYGAGLTLSTHWRLFGPEMNIDLENIKYSNWVRGLNDYLKSTLS
ncbi:MAG: UDP-2,3-diacetamido-2,3-dideoxy-D-glucuronate 2-epimerase [Owenweeksia sp. TMED14]|nr:MAG: UDP-2,3-diacetamido-2,3-dideoxy-D-glucuronate 2-epimerase [Owenweeksia sp. TMED14]